MLRWSEVYYVPCSVALYYTEYMLSRKGRKIKTCMRQGSKEGHLGTHPICAHGVCKLSGISRMHHPNIVQVLVPSFFWSYTIPWLVMESWKPVWQLFWAHMKRINFRFHLKYLSWWMFLKGLHSFMGRILSTEISFLIMFYTYQTIFGKNFRHWNGWSIRLQWTKETTT